MTRFMFLCELPIVDSSEHKYIRLVTNLVSIQGLLVGYGEDNF